MPVARGRAGVKQEMHKFKEGELHSGSTGKVVTSRPQAIAISLKEAGLSKQGKPTQPTRKTPGNIDFKTKLKHPKPSGLY